MGRVGLRVARDADIEEIRELVSAAYARYLDRLPVAPAPLSADYTALVSAQACRVAVTEERVVGLLVLRPRADHLLVENLAVLPDAEGRGIGSLLLDVAELEARESGIGLLRLYTNVAMTENLAFYGRRGFAETGRGTESGFDRVFLEKRLA